MRALQAARADPRARGQDAGGKVRLVKINIDENPELAQQLRIQSIPMVYAFSQGQPVDGFAGALPESQIKAFVERLAGPLGPARKRSRSSRPSSCRCRRPARARARSTSASSAPSPAIPRRSPALARCQIGLGRLAAARQTLERVPKEHANHVEIDGARAALSLAEEAGTLPDPEALRARLQANPDDHEARLDLATACSCAARSSPRSTTC